VIEAIGLKDLEVLTTVACWIRSLLLVSRFFIFITIHVWHKPAERKQRVQLNVSNLNLHLVAIPVLNLF